MRLRASTLNAARFGSWRYRAMRFLFRQREAGGYYSLRRNTAPDYAIYQTLTSNAAATNVGDPIGLYLSAPRDEMGIVNRLLWSEDMAVSPWLRVRATVTPDATAAPNGAMTADKLVEDTSVTNAHYARQSFEMKANTLYTMSAFFKKAEREFVHIKVYSSNGFSVSAQAYVNLTTGIVAVNGAGATAGIEDQGNGWYRAWLSQTSGASDGTAVVDYQLAVGMAFADTNYTGDGSSGIFVWGAQVNEGGISPYQANKLSFGGPGEHFVQPTSTARPTLGRVPKGLGAVNRATETYGNFLASWPTATLTNTGTTITGPSGAQCPVWSSPGTASTSLIYRVVPVVPSTTMYVSFDVYAGTFNPANFVFALYNETAGSWINQNVTPSPPVTIVAGQWARVGFPVNIPAGCTAIRVYPLRVTNSAGTMAFDRLQVNAGASAAAVQLVGGAFDITQDGIESISIPYYDGGDFLSLGKPALSDGCSLFADANQKWSVGGVFNTLNSSTCVVFSKAGASGGSAQLALYLDPANSRGAVRVRGGLTLVPTLAVNDGKFHTWLICWDGASAYLYMDNAAPIALTVGSSSEETSQNIGVGAANNGGTQFITGFNDVLLMRSGPMSQADIAGWRKEVNERYGIAA